MAATVIAYCQIDMTLLILILKLFLTLKLTLKTNSNPYKNTNANVSKKEKNDMSVWQLETSLYRHGNLYTFGSKIYVLTKTWSV